MPSLVIGASGLVGSALMRALGEGAVGTYRTRPRPGLIELDASNDRALGSLIHKVGPDTVYMPAAEPNVEWCETHPDEAWEFNLVPVRNVLRVLEGARLVGYSSDYVFDGEAGPYGEDAATRPVSVYGRVKVKLEEWLLQAGQTVVRTTTVFGIEVEPAKNYVLRLIASLRKGEAISVPYDQFSTPTFADDLASASARLAIEPAGLWHVAGPELMSRVDLARRVAEVFDLPTDLLRPVRTVSLGQKARRPLRGGLSCAKFTERFGRPHRPTTEALLALRSQAPRVDRSEDARHGS